MGKYKISILVAAYNAEVYLSECLDSLLNQTLKDIQIICIDDASTDGTLPLLEKYAGKDSRIVVLSQSENQGQAAARNRGLLVAEGEFITMLDSDDWFSADALESAYQVVRKHPATDAVIFDLEYYHQDTGNYSPYLYRAEKKTYCGEEALFLSLDWKIHGLYMVRSHIHKAYPYDTSSRMYSDDNTTRFHYLHSREVRFCEGIYYYRLHAQSNTNIHTVRRFDFMDAGLSLKRFLQKEEVPEKIIARQENLRWDVIVGMYVYYLRHKKCFSPGERVEILSRFKEHVSQIETCLLEPRWKYKFGYIPFKNCFALFRVQVWLYDFIRRFYYRIMPAK